MATTKLSLGRQTDLNAQSGRITNVGTATAPTDAVNKSFVEGLLQGLDTKQSVRVATTTAGTLSSSFANGSVVDGVTLVTGDRILIKNQANGTENGIYVVNASGAPTRSLDADSNSEVTPNLYTFVEEGTENDNTGWTLSTNGTIDLGTTSLSFTKFTSAAAPVAGAGLTSSGNIINVESANGGIVVNADNIALTAADASLQIDSSGVKVRPGSAGQFAITNGSGVVTPTSLSGDVASVTGAGSVTLGSAIMRTANFVNRETPSGTVNGTNTGFALSNTPVTGSEEVYLNGLQQDPGSGNDYTISGANITFLFAPATGDKIRVSYRK